MATTHQLQFSSGTRIFLEAKRFCGLSASRGLRSYFPPPPKKKNYLGFIGSPSKVLTLRCDSKGIFLQNGESFEPVCRSSSDGRRNTRVLLRGECFERDVPLSFCTFHTAYVIHTHVQSVGGVLTPGHAFSGASSLCNNGIYNNTESCRYDSTPGVRLK